MRSPRRRQQKKKWPSFGTRTPSQSVLFPLISPSTTILPAVRINAKGREVIYLAKGQSARLVCPYELEAHDDGPDSLDIEWTRLNSDPTSLDNVQRSLIPAQQILSYHDHKVIYPGKHYIQQRGSFGAQDQAQHLSHFNMAKGSSVGNRLGLVADCCSGLQQRINFVIPDPSQYDASINLQDVQISDSATYECKVKKTTVASRKVTITVLERPSLPKCSVMGKVSLGHEVTLCCTSDAGNSPLAYQWARVADHLHGNTISTFATKGANPGDIVIKNLSHEHVGLYQCSVANKVGYSQCVLEISLANDSNQMIVVIGAVLGSVLFLILLLCLTMWIIYCIRRRKFKEEVNQIRVDSAPPRERGGKKSNQWPALGYLSNKNAQRGKYEPPKEQEDVEMLCPTTQDLNSRNEESEVQNKGSTSVTTKVRVHCAPAIPSSAQSQCRAPAPLPSPANLVGSEMSTSQRDTAQSKRGLSDRHGDARIIVSANSRKDLVL